MCICWNCIVVSIKWENEMVWVKGLWVLNLSTSLHILHKYSVLIFFFYSLLLHLIHLSIYFLPFFVFLFHFVIETGVKYLHKLYLVVVVVIFFFTRPFAHWLISVHLLLFNWLDILMIQKLLSKIVNITSACYLHSLLQYEGQQNRKIKNIIKRTKQKWAKEKRIWGQIAWTGLDLCIQLKNKYKFWRDKKKIATYSRHCD